MKSKKRHMGACRFVVVPLVAFLFPFTVALAADITFGVIGDQTGAKDIAASYQVLQSGVSALNAQNPNVVIHVGDLIESNNPPELITSLFSKASGILRGLKAPWYLTPGDHDVNPVAWSPDSPDRSNEQLFRSLYVKLNPLVKDNFYYSFDLMNYHFVSLYALEHLDTDPRWGNVFLSGISDTQYAWLQKDLSSMQPTTKGVIVFVHQPLWYNWGDWQRVHSLLRTYPTVAVIAGHFHYGQIEQYDFPYITVGATGADIKDTIPATGGLQFVTLVSVTGKDAKPTVIPLTASPPISLPPRSRMDRIQAVDSGLANGYIGTIYVKNGQLVGNCATSSPAVITLPGIGNPTNFSGVLALSVTPQQIAVSSPVFDTTICTKVSVDGMQCEMNKNAGIYYANTSIVGPDTSKPYTWKGTLKATTPIDAKAQIYLHAGFTYGTTGNLDYVGKQYSVPLVSCPGSSGK